MQKIDVHNIEQLGWALRLRSAWPPITCTGRLNVLECRHVKFVLQRHLTIQPSNLPPHLTYLNSGRPNGFDAALADLMRFDFLYITMSNVYRALHPPPLSSIVPGQDERKTNWKHKVSLWNNPNTQRYTDTDYNLLDRLRHSLYLQQFSASVRPDRGWIFGQMLIWKLFSATLYINYLPLYTKFTKKSKNNLITWRMKRHGAALLHQ